MPTTMRGAMGRWGAARALWAGLSRVRLAGDKWAGAAPSDAPQASLSHGPIPVLLCFCPSPLLLLLTPFSPSPSPPPPADINECEEDGVECGPGQMCFNTRGSYQCVDTPCPATYRQGSSPG